MNDTRRIHRLGEIDYGTSRTEVLALLNSIASGAGHNDVELPFPLLTVPCLLPNRYKEAIGLNWQYPEYDNVSNPTQTSNLHTFDADTEEYLRQIDFDAMDDEEQLDDSNNDAKEEQEEDTIEPIALNENQNEEENVELQLEVDAEVEHLLVLDQRSPETSLQTFSRLTNQEPWIPFRPLNTTTPKTQLDFAEYQLFQTMKKDFKRHISPGQPHGYKDFELAWNLEVAERYRKFMDSDYNNTYITIINRKSFIQLQQHHDDVIESERIGRVVVNNQMTTFNEVMTETRQLTAPRTGRIATPMVYPATGLETPFGAPTTLNPDIGRQGVRGNTNVNQGVSPWVVQAPTYNLPVHPLANFNKKTWCVKCGYQKKQHTKEERFGTKCNRDYCANCGEMCHHHNQNCIGPRCTKMPKYNSPYKLWYG